MQSSRCCMLKECIVQNEKKKKRGNVQCTTMITLCLEGEKHTKDPLYTSFSKKVRCARRFFLSLNGNREPGIIITIEHVLFESTAHCRIGVQWKLYRESVYAVYTCGPARTKHATQRNATRTQIIEEEIVSLFRRLSTAYNIKNTAIHNSRAKIQT